MNLRDPREHFACQYPLPAHNCNAYHTLAHIVFPLQHVSPSALGLKVLLHKAQDLLSTFAQLGLREWILTGCLLLSSPHELLMPSPAPPGHWAAVVERHWGKHLDFGREGSFNLS